MNKQLLRLTVLAVALQAAVVCAQGGRFSDDRAEAAEHGWLFDYDAARQLARKTNRPLMVVFRCVP
jgi:hypothetical protein